MSREGHFWCPFAVLLMGCWISLGIYKYVLRSFSRTLSKRSLPGFGLLAWYSMPYANAMNTPGTWTHQPSSPTQEKMLHFRHICECGTNPFTDKPNRNRRYNVYKRRHITLKSTLSCARHGKAVFAFCFWRETPLVWFKSSVKTRQIAGPRFCQFFCRAQSTRLHLPRSLSAGSLRHD